MSNKFIIWDLLPDQPDQIYCEAIHDDHEGFRLILLEKEGKKRLLRICYEQTLAYFRTEDGCLLDSLPSSIRKKGCFFYATESSWLERFHTESGGIYKDLEVKHYVVSAIEASVEILSVIEPESVWLHD